MKNSSYDRTTNILPNRASGYGAGPDGYTNAPFLSMTQPYAAGSLLSTVEDLNTWYQAVVAGKVISKESFQKATSSAVLNNGKKPVTALDGILEKQLTALASVMEEESMGF